MERDLERIESNQSALCRGRMAALVCARPSNVLLLSGYWPVTGRSIAVVTEDGRIGLVLPKDEMRLTSLSWAEEVVEFEAGSLQNDEPPTEAATTALSYLLKKFGISGTIGIEREENWEPSTYVGMHRYGRKIEDFLTRSDIGEVIAADETLALLKSRLTRSEITSVRIAVAGAANAFESAAACLEPGMSERDTANLFRSRLTIGHESYLPSRCTDFTFCMSGPNAANAYAAYQISTDRRLASGELAMIHCNSCVNGFWTDITRTYSLSEPPSHLRRMHELVLEARNIASAAVRPGVKASAVDAAARSFLNEQGFGREFKHGAGHGVGYAAIDHLARPRLHPASPDILEAGMIFNIEPAIYIEKEFGIRHCDMVLVTQDGGVILTLFHNTVEDCILNRDPLENGAHGNRTTSKSKHCSHQRKTSVARTNLQPG